MKITAALLHEKGNPDLHELVLGKAADYGDKGWSKTKLLLTEAVANFTIGAAE